MARMSVYYTNARSLMPKRDELLAYIDVEKPVMITITETWATSPVQKASTKTESTRTEEVPRSVLRQEHLI